MLKALEQTADPREFGLVLQPGDKYPPKGRLVAGAYEFDPATQTTEVASSGQTDIAAFVDQAEPVC